MHTSTFSVLLASLAATTGVSASPLWNAKRQSTASTSVLLPDPVGPAVAPASASLIATLQTAPSTVSKFQTILQENVPLKFQFNTGNNTGAGGKIVVANRANFPALVNTGISSAMGFLEPCAMNTLHTHPRAAEFLTVVQGTVQTGMILENGLTTEFNTTLNQFEGTVFPMGSVHFQVNPNCEPAIFVAGLNSEDPGASQIAQDLFEFSDDTLETVFGLTGEQVQAAKDIDAFRKNLPANVVEGLEACLASCPAAQNLLNGTSTLS